MSNLKSVAFFPNGNTMAFDSAGEQVPHAQNSWFRMYLKYLRSMGYSITELKRIQFMMPDGVTYRVIDVGDGELNWQRV